MSDFLALGAASETLRRLLEDRIELTAGTSRFGVSIQSPASPEFRPAEGTTETARVNVFLYRVAESAALRNLETPGRGGSSGFGRPPLSLELFYLVTAYATTSTESGIDETPAQFLLGSAMRVLHDHPIITPALVTERAPAGERILHPALQDAFEPLKITLDPIGLEELSKIWTALTVPYRVAAAYHVSLVQIESRRPRSFPQRVQPLPDAGPRVRVATFRHPRIERLAVIPHDDPTRTERPYPYARVLDRLVLHGENLGPDRVVVRLGTLEIVPATADERRVELVIPDAALPDGTPIPASEQLQPGPQTVRVVPRAGGSADPGFASNAAVFLLTPGLESVVRENGDRLRIVGSRLWHPRLPGETLVGPAVIPRAAYLPASTASEILVPVPFSEVTWPTAGWRFPPPTFPLGTTAPLHTLPLNLDVTFGTVGPLTAALPSRPANAAEFAALLETALRTATNPAAHGSPISSAFSGACVSVLADGHLLVVPGARVATLSVAASPVANALGLAAATVVEVHLSGHLDPFPVLTSDAPRLRLGLGGPAPASIDLALARRPHALAEAALLLESALRAVASEPALASARVAALGSRLAFLFPGLARPARFAPIPDTDPRTALELRLVPETPVRVRVNGAETPTARVAQLGP